MDNGIDIIKLFPLGLICIVVIMLIARYIKINGEATTISGVLFSLCLYLCIIPIAVALFGDDSLIQYNYNCLKLDYDAYIVACMAIMFFLITLLLSYDYEVCHNKFNVVNTITFDNIINRLSLITFIVGSISFMIYAHIFGGFSTLLMKAEYMRSFATDKSTLVSSQAYILVIPARLITVTPYLLLLCRKYSKKKILNTILIVVSTILAGLFYLANAGKTDIIIWGLSFLVPVLSYRFKHKWYFTIVLAILSLGMINYLDALFIYLGTGDFELQPNNGNLSYLAQFSYPIRNVLELDGIANLHGFRWGQDFITGVLNIIPGVNFEPSYVPTSEFYGGTNWKITGGVPNDAITFGYLQFGFLGVIIVAVIIGHVCALIDSCTKTMDNSFVNRVLKSTLVILYFTMFVNADVISIARNQFTLTILTMCVVLSRSKQRPLSDRVKYKQNG